MSFLTQSMPLLLADNNKDNNSVPVTEHSRRLGSPYQLQYRYHFSPLAFNQYDLKCAPAACNASWRLYTACMLHVPMYVPLNYLLVSLLPLFCRWWADRIGWREQRISRRLTASYTPTEQCHLSRCPLCKTQLSSLNQFICITKH